MNMNYDRERRKRYPTTTPTQSMLAGTRLPTPLGRPMGTPLPGTSLTNKMAIPERKEINAMISRLSEKEPAMQPKTGGFDANTLSFILGKAGQAVMGPYHQQSWQAQLGGTAADLAQKRQYSQAMADILAGKAPTTGLLTPEQQQSVHLAGERKTQRAFDRAKTMIDLKAKMVELDFTASEMEAVFEDMGLRREAGEREERRMKEDFRLREEDLEFRREEAEKTWSDERKLRAKQVSDQFQANFAREAEERGIERGVLDKVAQGVIDYVVASESIGKEVPIEERNRYANFLSKLYGAPEPFPDVSPIEPEAEPGPAIGEGAKPTKLIRSQRDVLKRAGMTAEEIAAERKEPAPYREAAIPPPFVVPGMPFIAPVPKVTEYPDLGKSLEQPRLLEHIPTPEEVAGMEGQYITIGETNVDGTLKIYKVIDGKPVLQ